MNPEQSLDALQSILEAVLPQMDKGKFSNVQRHFMRALLDQFKSHSQIYAELKTSAKHLKEALTETENAANTMLSLAETLQQDERTEDVGMQLSEACTFQDIVGQRLKQVQKTLDRYGDFLALMGTAPSIAPDSRMSGPGFAGETISQDEADRLMG
jgi:uncharacterized protein YydD (DUF2326 family)